MLPKLALHIFKISNSLPWSLPFKKVLSVAETGYLCLCARLMNSRDQQTQWSFRIIRRKKGAGRGCKKLLADVSYAACSAVVLEGAVVGWWWWWYITTGGSLNSPRVRFPEVWFTAALKGRSEQPLCENIYSMMYAKPLAMLCLLTRIQKPSHIHIQNIRL